MELPQSEHPARADPRFLSVRQVAKQLRVPHSVYTLCETGKLKYVRVLNAIRIARAELESFQRLRSTLGLVLTPTGTPAHGRTRPKRR